MPDLAILVVAILLGSVPWSNIAARRTRGVDLRAVGNGTVSVTALYRVAGFPALSVAGILDVAKGAVGRVLAGGRPWAPPRPPTGWVAAMTRSAVPDARLRAVALHAGAPDVAEELHDRLTGLGADGVLVGGFGPVMVVHTGPGLAGIAWWWEPA